jgi:hypothetical protein
MYRTRKQEMEMREKFCEIILFFLILWQQYYGKFCLISQVEVCGIESVYVLKGGKYSARRN